MPNLPNHLPLREIAVMLVKNLGHHEGLFDISIELGFSAGAFEFQPHGRVPGAVVGIVGVGLVRSTTMGPSTVDAAIENPRVPPAEPKPKGSPSGARKRSVKA